MEHFRLEEWEIRPAEGSASREGCTLRLEPKLMDLLVCLARRPRRVCSKSEILDRVWHGAHVQEVVLSRGISELRRLLGDDARRPRLIETLPRRGYRLIGRVVPLLEEGVASAEDAREEAVAPREAGPPARRFPSRTLLAAGLALVLLTALTWWILSIPTPGSLAVLPFANFSGDPQLDAFCDGLTEDVIARLSELRGLRVVSRTTAMRYRESPLELRQIARRLHVASVLEGSVRREGARVRIVVQLIDGSADRHRWSATYEREIRDRFDLQLDISNTIAGALQKMLTPEASSLLGRAPTDDLTAYDLYLRGRGRYLLYTSSANESAIELFTRAVEADPGFALAHAGLASALALRRADHGGGEADIDRAAVLARRALVLSPALPEAHKAQGLVLSLQGRPRQALAAYQKALGLRPGYGEALHNIAFLQYQLDEWDEVGHWLPPASSPRELR